MEPITQRLHVSGLTPAISQDDISRRLSAFGSVKSLDGFGKLDSVGQPRKFGYVTLETTRAQLAKCLNTLSGSVWKGAKLRIGEAKPDFHERIACERVENERGEPLRKKARRVSAIHASDMSPVTPEIANTRGGWRVTPMGRIVRPMRMRHARPLDPQTAQASNSQSLKRDKKRKKPKLKEPPTRARIRTIDPIKWDSTHLKGMFLETDGFLIPHRDAKDEFLEEPGSSSSDTEEEDEVYTGDVEASAEGEAFDESGTILAASTFEQPLSVADTSQMPTSSSIEYLDVGRERQDTLNFLQNLFEGRGEEWERSESVGSDIDEEQILNEQGQIPSGHDDFDQVQIEEVPLVAARSETPHFTTSTKRHSQHVPEHPSAQSPTVPQPQPQFQSQSQPQPSAQTKKLKDLFAPREHENTSSIFGNLGLDLELDDDLDIVAPPQEQTDAGTELLPSRAAQQVRLSRTSELDFDFSKPLFFPLHPDLRTNLKSKEKGQIRDLFDVAKSRGWNWRDCGFFRSDTEDAIRQQWEESKLELTQQWKRRHREARKLRRRRGGAGGEE